MFIIKRHVLINGLTVLSLSFKKIEQILNGRMEMFCNVGVFFIVVACVLLASVSIRKKYDLHSFRVIKEIGFWSLLAGIVIVVISLLPSFLGTGNGENSTGVDDQTSWISESDLRSFVFGDYESVSFEEAQDSVVKKKAAYIRVFGNKVFFSNHLCKGDELSVLISEIPDNTTTYLIDDYAEDKVYNSVEKILTAQSINPERLESKKNE